MQKARGHTVASNIVLPLLVSRRFQVLFHSGPPVLFTFPSRYWFTIGHRLVFSLGRWSSRIPTGFHVSRGTQGTPRVRQNFVYRAITVYGRPFHAVLLSINNLTLGPHNPIYSEKYMVWANPRSLAATNGIIIYFLFLQVLRCFNSLRSPHTPMYSMYDSRVLPRLGFPIRKSPDQSLLAAHRSLSQLSTSFIAYRYQGIRRLPLVA